MEAKKFICHSKAKLQYDFVGNPIGMGVDRALYYSKEIGKGRIYRSSYPVPSDKNLKVFEFDTAEDAKWLCDNINTAYNDDFSPLITK